MIDRFGHLSARPVREEDEPFLAGLYASTRADLLHIPVPRAVIDAIVAHQRQLQTRGYADSYPGAAWLLLEHLGAPVGRVVLNEAAGQVRVVDLAIAPHARRQGHARAVLLALQARARGRRLDLALRVRKDNPGARALYLGLGFRVIDTDEATDEMRWTPLAAAA